MYIYNNTFIIIFFYIEHFIWLKNHCKITSRDFALWTWHLISVCSVRCKYIFIKLNNWFKKIFLIKISE